MAEKLTPKELPHEFLLKKYNLKIEDLSAHTQQLKSDLEDQKSENEALREGLGRHEK